MFGSSRSSHVTLSGSAPGPAPGAYYTAGDLSRILQIPRKRIYALGLPEVRLSPACIRYLPSAVSQWLDQRSGRAP